MDALEAIFKRRSIRRYRDEPVPAATVKLLLEAAMSAPSAGNQQPWHFVVVTDRKVLDAVTEVHPYAQMLKQAPAAIVVCGDVASLKHPGFWVQDCSAAVQNILVAATAAGLGSCWVGVHPRAEREEAIRRVFRLPDHVTPLAVVALGYADEIKDPVMRYDDERVHRDEW